VRENIVKKLVFPKALLVLRKIIGQLREPSRIVAVQRRFCRVALEVGMIKKIHLGSELE